VQYSSFHDAVALRTVFAKDLKEAGIDPMAPVSGCRTPGAGASGHWWATASRSGADDRTLRHHIGKRTGAEQTGGQVMCYWQGDDAVIEWYDSDTHIYAWATGSRDDNEALFNWWTARAGPIHPSMPMSMLTPTGGDPTTSVTDPMPTTNDPMTGG
jgi:hypothetical protein